MSSKMNQHTLWMAVIVGAMTFAIAPLTALASVTITGAPATVTWEVEKYAVTGTNTSDLVGDMWVSNASAGGVAISFTRSGLAFATPAVPLVYGHNYISIYGTNAAADVSSDTVNIWRYNIDGSGEQSGSAYGRRLPGMLVGWGENNEGQTICPSDSNYVAIAAGGLHSLALRRDGTLVGWGWNYYGQTNCPSGSNYVAIAAGESYSLALRRDGTLVGWGVSLYGETICPRDSNYVAVAGGEYHSLALRRDGTLVSWGDNYYGQTNCPSGSNYVAIVAGDSHSLALRRDGTLVGWGASGHGRTNCPNGSNYVAIAAGWRHSLALRSDGTLVGWGLNNYGQTNCPSGSNYVAIAAGDSHSLALRRDGTLVAWAGLTNCPSSEGHIMIAAGGQHNLAIGFVLFIDITNSDVVVTHDVTTYTLGGTNSPLLDEHNQIVGMLWWMNTLNGVYGTFAATQSWTITDVPLAVGANGISVYGTNVYGWVGSDNVTITRMSQLTITSALAAVSYDVTCYAVAGTNTSAIVGDMWVSNATAGGTASSFTRSGLAFTTPAVPLDVGRNYITVYGTNAAGDVSSDMVNIWSYNIDGSGEQSGSTYGRRVSGVLVGWGISDYGQTNCPRGSDFVAIAAGDDHSVAVRCDGTLVGWGDNSYGQTTCPTGNDYVAVAAGDDHSVAVRRDGTLVGWGRNNEAQTICPTGNDYVAIAAGDAHSLAVRRDGALVDWGKQYSQPTCPPGNDYVAIAVGGGHSLALRRDGTLVGWGDNGAGQTTCPGGNDYIAIAAGMGHSLALRHNGTLVGWGYNNYGQTTCPGGSNYVAISAGGVHSLALLRDGTLVGWGGWFDLTNCPNGGNHVMITAGNYHSLAIEIVPFVDVTNDDVVVDYYVTTHTLGGTNSPALDATNQVVGAMWWTNALNGAQGAFAAQEFWTIQDIPVAEGTNALSVYGTNVFGWLGGDSVTVTVVPEPVLVLSLTALFWCVRQWHTRLNTVTWRKATTDTI